MEEFRSLSSISHNTSNTYPTSFFITQLYKAPATTRQINIHKYFVKICVPFFPRITTTPDAQFIRKASIHENDMNSLPSYRLRLSLSNHYPRLSISSIVRLTTSPLSNSLSIFRRPATPMASLSSDGNSRTFFITRYRLSTFFALHK